MFGYLFPSGNYFKYTCQPYREMMYEQGDNQAFISFSVDIFCVISMWFWAIMFTDISRVPRTVPDILLVVLDK